MSSRGSHRISFARHVYLRTQQHRLRHVKSIVVRNLNINLTDLQKNFLRLEVYFTIHSSSHPDHMLYKSYSVRKSYNPSWEAVQFNPADLMSDKYSSISSFLFKVWYKIGFNQESLAFEKLIDLSSLVYLGTLVNKDSSPYPPNSVVVGMFEGYYSYPSVGGVPCPPKITHALEKLLPPQSLLEVNKLEVKDSYIHSSLVEVIIYQESLNKSTQEAIDARKRVEHFKSTEDMWLEKRRKREFLELRISLLQTQLLEKEKEGDIGSNRLQKFRADLDEREQVLSRDRSELELSQKQYDEDYQDYCKQREMLLRAKRNQFLRQKNMISEAAQMFFISERKDKYTICNVILNSDQLDQPSNIEQPGVALGYVAHLVNHLAKILLVPLQYEVRPNGSRSHICDFISDEPIIDDIREFPLYLKGVERALFHYGVHLMNKNIAQVRQHCGFGMSRTMLKRTLPNLKLVLDKIISELNHHPATPGRLSGYSPSSSVPTTPVHSTPTSITPIPIDRGRIQRERTPDGRPSVPAGFVPRTRVSTDPEAYSSSVTSTMSFQPSEDGDSTRPLTPSDPSLTAITSSSTTQQYPTMLADVASRHYPVSIPKAQGPTANLPSVQSVPDSSPEGPQSSAHADLHKTQFFDITEEMVSIGSHANLSNNNQSVAHTHSHSNISSRANSETNNEFVVGIGAISDPSQPSEKNKASSIEGVAPAIEDDQESISYHDSHKHNKPHFKSETSSDQDTQKPVKYHQHTIELLYNKTGLATPHRVTGTDNKELPIIVHTKQTQTKEESDGLLEDFIDGL